MKTIENLIDKIVELRIELFNLNKKYIDLYNEWNDCKNIIRDLQNQIKKK